MKHQFSAASFLVAAFLCRTAVGQSLDAAGPSQVLPPSSVLHKTEISEIASLSRAPIIFPVRCGTSGQPFLRLYKSEPMGSPIIELSADGKSVKHTYDFRALADAQLPKAKQFTAADYQAIGSRLYIIGTARKGGTEALAEILEFSTDDGTFRGVIPLETNFTPYRMAFFESGGLITTGLLTQFEPQTKKSRTELVTLRYGPDLKLIEQVHLFGDTTFADNTPTQEEVSLLSGTHLASYASTVYMLRMKAGGELALYEIKEGDNKVLRHTLWTPGDKWQPMAFLVSGDTAIIGFVHDLENDGRTKQYVQYSLSSRAPLAAYFESDEVVGAFACYDWASNYTFITSRNDHVAILRASAR
jgi:hypothetical protein